jgi:hypothetical protein
MMPCVAVVLFDQGRMRLADESTFPRQDVGEALPIVGTEDAIPRQPRPQFAVSDLTRLSLLTKFRPQRLHL